MHFSGVNSVSNRVQLTPFSASLESAGVSEVTAHRGVARSSSTDRSFPLGRNQERNKNNAQLPQSLSKLYCDAKLPGYQDVFTKEAMVDDPTEG